MAKYSHELTTLAFPMISKRIVRLVELTKWPVALFALLTIPFTFYAWGKLFYQVQSYPGYSLMFAIGVGLFVILARTTLAQSSFASRIVELERDVTQSLLAFAMLYPVMGYVSNPSKSSRMRWLGRGNWIMLAAPNFVPTATIALWLVSLLLYQPLRSVVLGFGISYHLTAVVIQCRIGTREIRRLGRKFCWMFMPATNFVVAGLVAAYALNGFGEMGDFAYDWTGPLRMLSKWLWAIFFPSKV